MPVLRKEGPYIWVTWVTKLLTGDDSCEHASWFKTQFDGKSWTRAERVNNLARWQVGHTDMLNAKALDFREQGYQVSREAQNHFTIKGRQATIAGKPDLIARQGDLVWVADVKAGRPRSSDLAQVMIYMYLLPIARPELRGATIKGVVVYGNREQEIQPEEVDPAFVQSLQGLIHRLAALEPAAKVPSWSECQFCDISKVHCPERVEQAASSVVTTDRF